MCLSHWPVSAQETPRSAAVAPLLHAVHDHLCVRVDGCRIDVGVQVLAVRDAVGVDRDCARARLVAVIHIADDLMDAGCIWCECHGGCGHVPCVDAHVRLLCPSAVMDVRAQLLFGLLDAPADLYPVCPPGHKVQAPRRKSVQVARLVDLYRLLAALRPEAERVPLSAAQLADAIARAVDGLFQNLLAADGRPGRLAGVIVGVAAVLSFGSVNPPRVAWRGLPAQRHIAALHAPCRHVACIGEGCVVNDVGIVAAVVGGDELGRGESGCAPGVCCLHV